MLSHPIPPEEATSEAIIFSNMSSTTSLCLDFFDIYAPTMSTASWEERQSHIPSQAMIMKAVSGPILSFFISGTAVIIY
jgi:hypothetical protein